MLFRRAAICCGLQVQLTLKEVHRNKKQEKKNGSYVAAEEMPLKRRMHVRRLKKRGEESSEDNSSCVLCVSVVRLTDWMTDKLTNAKTEPGLSHSEDWRLKTAARRLQTEDLETDLAHHPSIYFRVSELQLRELQRQTENQIIHMHALREILSKCLYFSNLSIHLVVNQIQNLCKTLFKSKYTILGNIIFDYFFKCTQVRVEDWEEHLPHHSSPFGPHQHNWNSSSAEIAFHAGNACSACSKSQNQSAIATKKKQKKIATATATIIAAATTTTTNTSRTAFAVRRKTKRLWYCEKTSSWCTIKIC